VQLELMVERSVGIVAIAAAALIVTARPAAAHPPYEGHRRILKTRAGDVEVVKSYIDGIMLTDPSKVIVRFAGQVRAETPYFRETSIACIGQRCLVAASDSPLSVIPHRTWVVEGTSLRAADSWGLRVIGVAVHWWDHLLGYALALLFGALPGLTFLHILDRPSPRSVPGILLLVVIVIAACGLMVLWFSTVALASELSLVWAIVLVVLGVATTRRVAAAVRARRGLS